MSTSTQRALGAACVHPRVAESMWSLSAVLLDYWLWLQVCRTCQFDSELDFAACFGHEKSG